MRIDAHQHFWKYLPEEYLWIGQTEKTLKQDYLPHDLSPILKQYKMDGSIAVQARQTEEENRFLLNLAIKCPAIKAVVGWVNLRSPDLPERLDYWSGYALMKGFRHMVQDEPVPSEFFADQTFNQGINELQNRGLVYEVLVHSADLESAVRFCARHDNGPLVIDHMGKPKVEQHDIYNWTRQIIELSSMEHVCCKISGLVTEAVWHAWQPDELTPYINIGLEAFGAGRIMFGSDWPVCTLAADVEQVYQLVKTATADLSKHEKEAVWGDTACRIYGLTKQGETYGSLP